VGRSWAGGWGRLTSGDGRTERESGRMQGNQRRQVGPTTQRERERGSERAHVCADRRGPPVSYKGRAGPRGGWANWVDLGRNDPFLFPGISIAFSNYFL
jgi:hypothetical protein